MSHLTLTEAQYIALRNKRTSLRRPSGSAAVGAVKADKWPIVLRDQIVAAELPEPFREFTFHATRGWRLDLAWPDFKQAIEIDGQVHSIKDKRARDIEKHNALMMAGWVYLRFAPRQVETGEAIATVKEWLA